MRQGIPGIIPGSLRSFVFSLVLFRWCLLRPRLGIVKPDKFRILTFVEADYLKTNFSLTEILNKLTYTENLHKQHINTKLALNITDC